jgi:hypothetical protein
MNALKVLSLAPFVPSGESYAASRKFFADLGFDEIWENNGCAGFESGTARFILQNSANNEFAANYMVSIVVPDLDLWWAAISEKKLEEIYAGVRFAPPKVFPWGREVHFIDLAGVCWHVRQSE